MKYLITLLILSVFYTPSLLAEDDGEFVIDGGQVEEQVEQAEEEVQAKVEEVQTEVEDRNADAKEFLENQKLSMILDKSHSSQLFFDYGQLNANILHEETSSTSGFTSLDTDTNIMVHMIGLGYQYEVLSNSLISFTLTLGAGFQTGEDVGYDRGESNQFDLKDKVTGYYGAGGMSFNINHRHNNYRKTQYFLGARTIKSLATYFLRYEVNNSSDRSTEIEYELDTTIVETSLGVRFFEFGKKNMFSAFSINQVAITTNSLDGSASAGDTEYELTRSARFKFQEYSARLSFGFLY